LEVPVVTPPLRKARATCKASQQHEPRGSQVLAAGAPPAAGHHGRNLRPPQAKVNEHRHPELLSEILAGSPASSGLGFKHVVSGRAVTKRYMVECFSGTSRMAQSFAQNRIPAYSFEITRDANEDVMSALNTGRIMHDMKQQLLFFCWLGVMCASWSRARRGNPNGKGWPPPLRNDDADGIWGFSNMSSKDTERIRLGNKSALWCCKTIRHAIRFNVPIVIENPATSRLWLFPPLRRLILKSQSDIFCDHCQFGAPWRKHTRLISWNCDISSMNKVCKTSNHCCSRTHRPHQVLTGTDKSGGYLTALASAYPKAFCDSMCHDATKMKETHHPPS
jgi:hypothetical protein